MMKTRKVIQGRLVGVVSPSPRKVNAGEEVHTEFIRHGVTRLCHVTPLRNLASILYHNTGILALDYNRRADFCRTDSLRLDGKTEYISTSIQYPNVWYYRAKKNTCNDGGDWAVIFIDPSISKQDNSLFSRVNASRACGAYVKPGKEALTEVFSDSVNGRGRSAGMLSNCATDDQAEVLVHGVIPTSFFTGIAFEKKSVLERFMAFCDYNRMRYPALYVAPELFSAGLSYKIRNGLKPVEIKVREESALWQKDQCS